MLLKCPLLNSPVVKYIFAGYANTFPLQSEKEIYFPDTLILQKGGKANQMLLRDASFVFYHSPSSAWPFSPHINATSAMPTYKLLSS